MLQKNHRNRFSMGSEKQCKHAMEMVPSNTAISNYDVCKSMHLKKSVIICNMALAATLAYIIIVHVVCPPSVSYVHLRLSLCTKFCNGVPGYKCFSPLCSHFMSTSHGNHVTQNPPINKKRRWNGGVLPLPMGGLTNFLALWRQPNIYIAPRRQYFNFGEDCDMAVCVSRTLHTFYSSHHNTKENGTSVVVASKPTFWTPPLKIAQYNKQTRSTHHTVAPNSKHHSR